MTAEKCNTDRRINKTKKALINAMSALLRRQSFKKLTVKDICEEAMVSRAAFYSHFLDKYDFLSLWLTDVAECFTVEVKSYESWEKSINEYFADNKCFVKNVLEDADYETLNIVFEFILSSFKLNTEDEGSAVLSSIFAGGIMYYLLWNVKNKFPISLMNPHLYELIEMLRGWGSRKTRQ